jgi:hypothetical protein
MRYLYMQALVLLVHRGRIENVSVAPPIETLP